MRPESPCAFRHHDCSRAPPRCASRRHPDLTISRFSYPRLELRIGRLVLPDVVSDCLLFESERGERHRVETLADAGITGSKFARFFERDLLPETREMKNAKWTGNAGTDQWNICVSHGTNFGNPSVDELQVPALRNVCYARSAASYCHSERSEESRISFGYKDIEMDQRCFALLNMTAICIAE